MRAAVPLGGPSFSAVERVANLERLSREPLDVLVIGGGITGAGVALDAASRGLRTGMVEQDDFASGTSSRSSRLIHGGLRYLSQREFGLVREALVERQQLLRLAPHLVRPLPFLIPVLVGSGAARKTRARAVGRAVGAALWAYDVAGGSRIGRNHRRLDRQELLRLVPALEGSRVAGGFLYYDAQADDARLTLAVVKSAALEHGAAVANYAGARALYEGPGGTWRVEVEDRLSRISFEVATSCVVDATGVWAGGLVARPQGPSLRPAKGVHLTLAADRLRLGAAVVLPVQEDGRSIFLVPSFDRAYLGTTDTDHAGGPDRPMCTGDDARYLLSALSASLAEPVGMASVTGSWAGLRPLLASASGRTADLSRRHVVSVEGGIVTVVGGKLTTYRRMAAQAVDAVLRVLEVKAPPSRTAGLVLFGAGADAAAAVLAGQDPPPPAIPEPPPPVPTGATAGGHAHLAGRYGTYASAVAVLAEGPGDLGSPLVAGLPYLRAEATYAVRHEMVLTLEDLLVRRTRALALDREATARAAPAAASLLGGELGWSAEEVRRQIEVFSNLVEAERQSLSASGAG
ncbi:MAG: FAD-dependent oxidoreductase [Acidimicrobiia bacterium]